MHWWHLWAFKASIKLTEWSRLGKTLVKLKTGISLETTAEHTLWWLDNGGGPSLVLGGAVHDSICPSLMLSEIYNTLSGAAQICADPLIFRFSGPLHRHYNHPRGKLHVTLLTPGHSHTHGHMQLALPTLYDILSIQNMIFIFNLHVES